MKNRLEQLLKENGAKIEIGIAKMLQKLRNSQKLENVKSNEIPIINKIFSQEVLILSYKKFLKVKNLRSCKKLCYL